MKVLVTGAGGMLGRAVVAELGRAGHEPAAFDRSRVDVTDAGAVEAALREARPDGVVQCAGYTRVDEAEREEERAFAVNADGTANVARACREMGARLLYPSTDYVFDGRATSPYPPAGAPAPLGAYGRSKLAGEAAALEAGDALVVRTAWLYGAGGQNFVRRVLDRARDGEPLQVVDDQLGSPTWTRDLAVALVRLLERDAPPGVYHATSRGFTTWFELAREAVDLAGLAAEVAPISTADWLAQQEQQGRPRARRPLYSVLDCRATEELVGALPHWRDALVSALEEGV